MFTGIIEEIGSIIIADSTGGGKLLKITAPESARELRVGESVAINGVCLTVNANEDSSFTAMVVEETLKKTTFHSLRSGSRVNLELPMRLNERLGGHLVLGHVDTVGKVTRVERRESSTLFTLEVGAHYAKYLIPVGSIAIDGVSLTIASVQKNIFTVSIIPHTMEQTIVPAYEIGTEVNVEFDLIGKYIERLAFMKSFPTEEDLRAQGF